MTLVQAASLLSAQASLTAAAAPPDLWGAYQAAALTASDLWQQWRMMRTVAATDGTAGRLYSRAYTAQQAADAAYEAYLDDRKRVFGARG